MTSALNTFINTYTLERGLELDESYSTSPTRTGTATVGTFALAASNAGTPTYDPTQGPSNGGGSWKLGNTSTNRQQIIMNESTWANDGDFTIGFWTMTPRTLSGYVNMFQFNPTETTTNWGIRLENTMAASGRTSHVVTHGTISRSNAYTGSTPQFGRWYYVAMRRVASTGLDIYIDGTLTGSISNTYNAGTLVSILIGDSYTGFTGGTNAGIHYSNFHIAPSSVLTATAIAAISAKGHEGYEHAVESIYTTVPQHFYKLNETSGSTLTNQGEYYAQYGDITLAGTLGTDYTFGTGVRKGALSCGSSWSDMTTGATQTAAFTYNYTIAFWLKKSSAPSSNQTWMTGGNGSTYDMNGEALIETSGKISFHPKIANNSGGTKLISTNSICDGAWHHIAITRSGATIKLYVDGTENATTSNYNTGVLANQTIKFGSANTSFDSFAIWNTALTAANITTLFNSEVTNLTTAASPMTSDASTVTPAVEGGKTVNYNASTATSSSDMPMPSISVGTGITQAADPSTSSSLFVMPTIATQKYVNYSASPMTIAAQCGLSDVTIVATKTVTVSVTSLSVSAELHEPQYSIGANHAAASLDGSANVPYPTVVAVKYNVYSAAVSTASADSVNPTVSSETKGKVIANAMTATAFIATPPAYYNKLSDLWFTTLRTQNVLNVGLGDSLLKTFGDVNSNITPPDINQSYTYNDMTIYNGKKFINDIPGLSGQSFYKYAALYSNPNQSGITSPTPLLEVNYFDSQNRKAVRLRNIAFTDPAANNTVVGRNYSFTAEYIINTTKTNQIISIGTTDDPTSGSSYSARNSSIGLYNGKLYLSKSLNKRTNLHPLNSSLGLDASTSTTDWTVGNKNIADGQWHHIVIQYESPQSRFQIWIDGQLDIQRYLTGGFNMPTELGYNSDTSAYSPDFLISGWSVKPNIIVDQTTVVTHYLASINYVPIKAEPMLASITATQDNKAKGNRARALMLYWWPVWKEFGRVEDNGRYGEFDFETFDDINTTDYVDEPPTQYYGWDIFPVDINGYYVSEIVKPNSYGGEQNIELNDFGGANPPAGGWKQFKTNRRGYFRDNLTDDRRYIDVLNDIDLSQIDCIMFRNYPDQPQERTQYAQNEIVDSYFGTIEKELYEKFLTGLRAAVDSGISLYVTNTQLALDLGIVDRIESIPDLSDKVLNDPYAASLHYQTKPTGGIRGFRDNHKNNRMTIKNTISGLTDNPTVVRTDLINWMNDDKYDFGGYGMFSEKYELKSNGLAVNDTFLLSDINPDDYPRNVQAVPLANIKAGKAVTTFASTYRQGMTEVVNPYKDYALHIAVEPGDVLNGSQVGGKIFVSFTERFSGASNYIYGPQSNFQSADFGMVELIQDKWINQAYSSGAITLADKNALIASPDNLDRQLEIATNNNNAAEIALINKKKYWDLCGENVLSQQNANVSNLILSSKITAPDTTNKVAARDASTSTTTHVQQAFFTFKYSRKYRVFTFVLPSMMTRGFIWLSTKIELPGTVIRPVAALGYADMLMPQVTTTNQLTVNAQPMISNATIVKPVGYSSNSVSITSLPLEAFAQIMHITKLVIANAMSASATLRTDVSVLTSSTDEVVLYISHTDPILYLREEVIK